MYWKDGRTKKKGEKKDKKYKRDWTDITAKETGASANNHQHCKLTKTKYYHNLKTNGNKTYNGKDEILIRWSERFKEVLTRDRLQHAELIKIQYK